MNFTISNIIVLFTNHKSSKVKLLISAKFKLKVFSSIEFCDFRPYTEF